MRSLTQQKGLKTLLHAQLLPGELMVKPGEL